MAKKPEILKAVVDISGKVSPGLSKAIGKTQGMLKSGLGKAAIGGAVGAVAVAIKGLVSDYNKAYRTIRIGTGATGKDLRKLMGDVNSVLRGSAAEIGEVAQVVSDFNTNFGASGEQLQNISRAAISASKIFGDDLKSIVDGTSKSMKAFGIDVRYGTEYLNFLGGVSQTTGVSITDLQRGLTKAAPQLKALGYSSKTSAVLLGNLAKSGVSTEKAVSALNKISTLGKDNWIEYYSQIKTAENEQEALRISAELFGKESGPAMAQAIRNGAFAVGSLTSEIEKNATPLSKLQSETEGVDEMLQEISNTLKASVMPVVEAVIRNVRDCLRWWKAEGPGFLQSIKSFVEPVVEFLKPFVETLVKMQTWLPRLGLKAAKAGFEMISGAQSEEEYTRKSLTNLPRKALGGWVSSPSLCGEAGPETVISYAPAVRSQNLAYWAEAGQALGVLPRGGTSIDLSGLTFSPVISTSSANQGDVLGQLRAQSRDFADLLVQTLDSRLARSY